MMAGSIYDAAALPPLDALRFGRVFLTKPILYCKSRSPQREGTALVSLLLDVPNKSHLFLTQARA